MGIVQLPTLLPAQVGINPARKPMVTTNSLAQIRVAGYLNQFNLAGNPISETDLLEVIYAYNPDTNTGTFGFFTISITNGVITLVPYVNFFNINLPVVQGNVATFATTNGVIQDSGILGTTLMVATSANQLTGSGSISLVKGIGTEAANAVTINNNAGVITTSALTTAGAGSYAITFTNSFITTPSVINLTLMGGTNTTRNITIQATAGTGTSTLTIFNNTAATALNGTLIIGFTVF